MIDDLGGLFCFAAELIHWCLCYWTKYPFSWKETFKCNVIRVRGYAKKGVTQIGREGPPPLYLRALIWKDPPQICYSSVKYKIYVTDGMFCMKGTTSVPKSVLRYVEDMNQKSLILYVIRQWSKDLKHLIPGKWATWDCRFTRLAFLFEGIGADFFLKCAVFCIQGQGMQN